MIKRTIEIINTSYLFLKHKQCVIEQDGKVVGRVPIEDMGVLILANPAIVITQCLIAACLENNVVIIFCNKKHLPVAVLLPLAANSLHTKILQSQIQVKAPLKKKLWQQLIREKIYHQAQLLKNINNHSTNVLLRLAKTIKSGDSANHEAQAAKKYWPVLFGKAFRRDIEAEGLNSLLNYGYAILRAAVARAICGSGLHPALGLFHTNQYNSLCLADDLMEPLRPLVDRAVLHFKNNFSDQLDMESKQALLKILAEKVIIDNKELPLMVALQYFTASMKTVIIEADAKQLKIPRMIL